MKTIAMTAAAAKDFFDLPIASQDQVDAALDCYALFGPQSGNCEIAERRHADWDAVGRPSVPLAVIRHERVGDSNLKAIRILRRLIQKDLADRAGIKQVYLSELEAALEVPGEQTRLAKALQRHPVFLSDTAPTPEPATAS